MTFLQPVLLFGLPAVLIPVLIHLLNRLRFRSVKWAAMMFLVSATRSSTKRARLRHYLILLCRTLIILFLIIAMSRPIIGGWLGSTLAGAPDTIIVLLDRSASMEATDPRLQRSKREYALKFFEQAAAESAGASRFVLIENVLRKPQEIAGPAALDALSLATATDTAADIPAMFRSAQDYMLRNKTGRTEIWVASDLQKSNWRPGQREWQKITAQIAALPQDVRVRLLALRDSYERNLSVSLHSAQRGNMTENPAVRLALDIRSAGPRSDAIPLIITLDGARSQTDLPLKTQSFRYNRTMDLPAEKQSGGWGKAELPADENSRDNSCYFVYGEDIPLRAAVVSDSALPATYLRLATAPTPDMQNRSCRIVSPDDTDSIDWQELGLLIWQAPVPDEETEETIHAFAEDGGAVIFFPPGRRAETEDGTWGEVEKTGKDDPFRVTLWEENDGPLAQTANGRNLPVAELAFRQRQDLNSPEGHVLASYEDGKPFLLRRNMGAGRVFACTSLPREDWSNLANGTVLIPMLQRILQLGGRRLAKAEIRSCGEWQPAGNEEIWTPLDSTGHKNPQWEAGAYQCGTRKVALNRPAHEDNPEIVEKERVADLFGKVRVEILDDPAKKSSDKMRSEIWHIFVYLALACMLAESGLLLSNRTRQKRTANESGKR